MPVARNFVGEVAVQVQRAQCDRVAPISTWPTGWSEKIITGYVNCNVQVITTEPRLLEGF